MRLLSCVVLPPSIRLICALLHVCKRPILCTCSVSLLYQSLRLSLSLSLSLALPFYLAHPHTRAHTPAHHIHLCIRTHAHIGFLNASIIYRNYPRAFTPPLAFLYLPVPPRCFFCTYLYHPANFLLLPLISTRVYPVYTRKSCSTA
jgi:hypothetical protein